VARIPASSLLAWRFATAPLFFSEEAFEEFDEGLFFTADEDFLLFAKFIPSL
jgi:hypothetical protein